MDKQQLQQFSERIYWLPPDEATDRPVLGVIAGKHSSLIVDAGASVAHTRLLLEQVAQLDIAPIRYLFLTHWHWDHVFDTAVTLNLGDLTCQLIHVGGDHAADSSIAYIPEEKVVFLSDCLYRDLYTIPNRVTLAGIKPLYERVLALGAEAYFWGHDDEVYSRARMREEQEIMMITGRLAVENEGDVTAVIAQLRTTHPHLVDEYTPELITQFWHGQTVPQNFSFLP